MKKYEIQNPLEKPLQIFLSNQLQLGELIEQILSFIGPAEIVVTTFSTGEEFLRRLHRIRQRNLITNAVLISDAHAAEKTARMKPLINSIFDRSILVKNHSKVMLIQNDKFKITVSTSQNQTRGNRIENYCITSDEEIFEELYQTFKNYELF